jgi:hypothetical protein
MRSNTKGLQTSRSLTNVTHFPLLESPTIPQLIDELNTFGGPNKIGYSILLENVEIETKSPKLTSRTKYLSANLCHSQDP